MTPFRLPRSPRVWRRGFTLVELLIAVAMVAVLSALALVGYRRYVHSAQSNEARALIGMIRGGQEAYKAEFLVYLWPNGSSFASNGYYPNTSPNDSRMNWNNWNDTRFSDPVAGWALLNVNPDGPVRFGYACVAGVGGQLTAFTMLSPAPTMPTVNAGIPWYAIQAINDHNNNKIYAVFASTSTSSEILSQAEWE